MRALGIYIASLEFGMPEPFRVISWGCGVQSTTLAVMSALGKLPRVDAVITSDTGWERRATYDMRDFYTDWLRAHGVLVEIVENGNIRQQGAVEHIHIPFWTSNGGPLQRQCTRHFKIKPVKWKLRQGMGFHKNRPPAPKPSACEMWIGFSLDEWTRVKASRVKFIDHGYPLIERMMTRSDCIDFLQIQGLPVPPKSACVICPYRQASDWIVMRDQAPDEWRDAIDFDESNRHNPLAVRAGDGDDALYIYKHGGPLADANLEADAARERSKEAFQMPLLCESGYCWT